MIVFIHGGYWRSLSKDLFSHMASGLNKVGYDVVMPNYTLCPETDIAGICKEMELFSQHLTKTYKRPLLITGHSAGGHLAAWLCQKDTLARTGSDIIGGFGISGIYDLKPMLQTSMNKDFKLDIESAAASSPFLEEPQKDIIFDAWVGGNESGEFTRQSEMFAASWHTQGASTTFIEIASANHFTAIEPLTNADSLMVKRIVGLAS
ncbi:MAG: alpha/beta hydrolase [Rhizobiales bacterium]|nr:alpha/beta hydrolase [Hyphomicrobiales bacterium]